MDKKINDILKDKPFSKLLKIKKIELLAGEGALSNQTYLLIVEDNKKYKLRCCSKIEQAERIERNVKLLPNAFPKFLGRDKNYVLFEWIDGELLYDVLSKSIPKEVYYQIGEIVGEAHALNDINLSKSPDKFFNYIIKQIEEGKQIGDDLLKKIVQIYKKLKGKLKVDIVLEINDIQPRNFMIKNRLNPEKIKVYFVDEDGFGHKIKGLGLAKPLLIEGLIKTKEQKDAFWEGYNKHHDSTYFDNKYQEFVKFMQIIRSLAVRSRKNMDISNSLDLIKKYLE